MPKNSTCFNSLTSKQHLTSDLKPNSTLVEASVNAANSIFASLDLDAKEIGKERKKIQK